MDGSVLPALSVTLRVALAATVLCGLPGVALGYLLARRSFPGKIAVETLSALPLVLPPTAVGFLLLRLFSLDGPLGAAGLSFDVLLTWKGAVLASAAMAFPLVARTARVAFEGVEPRLETMARSLGFSRTRVLVAVTLPLARRGLLAAVALGFGRALGEFGATAIVAGSIAGETQTLSLLIYEELNLGHDAAALRLVGLTAVLAFGVLFAVERLLRAKGVAR